MARNNRAKPTRSSASSGTSGDPEDVNVSCLAHVDALRGEPMKRDPRYASEGWVSSRGRFV